ncbi:unnamed protein product [Calypogeia fissa]
MTRKRHSKSEGGGGCETWVIFVGVMCCSTLLGYAFFSTIFAVSPVSEKVVEKVGVGAVESKDSCCRGVKNLELWGRVVEWGSKFYTNSTEDCCKACKAFCTEKGVCECNSWVFCGDQKKCGNRFGQCWLKHQEDPLNPDIQASGRLVIWTSGLIYDGQDTGVLGMVTRHGMIRLKLLVDCAPYSVAYLLELKRLRHCVGCQIFRAEGRGSSWNEEGDKIGQVTSGPYALLQGTLAAESVPFREMPKESCPVVRRGSVGWIGGGPEFFISLANHDEWFPKHTIFAYVLEADMHIVEKIANLPTEAATFSGVNVSVLQEPIPLHFIKADSKMKYG